MSIQISVARPTRGYKEDLARTLQNSLKTYDDDSAFRLQLAEAEKASKKLEQARQAQREEFEYYEKLRKNKVDKATQAQREELEYYKKLQNSKINSFPSVDLTTNIKQASRLEETKPAQRLENQKKTFFDAPTNFPNTYNFFTPSAAAVPSTAQKTPQQVAAEAALKRLDDKKKEEERKAEIARLARLARLERQYENIQARQKEEEEQKAKNAQLDRLDREYENFQARKKEAESATAAEWQRKQNLVVYQTPRFDPFLTVQGAKQSAIEYMDSIGRQLIIPINQTSILSDGQCQFDSISRIVNTRYRTAKTAWDVRQEVMKYMRANIERFKPFITTNSNFNVNLTEQEKEEKTKEYLNKMSTIKGWGDNNTLAAAAELYNIAFVTLDTSIPRQTVVTIVYYPPLPKDYAIIYFQNVHYQLTPF